MKDRQPLYNAVKYSGALLILLLFSVSCAFSPKDVDIRINNSTHTIFSKILEENRYFSVYTISKSQNLDSISHTIYLFDGDDEFDNIIINQLKKFINKNNLPGIILVTIENVDRERDMTPVKTSFCSSPGADHFLNFIEQEIIPYVNTNYKKTSFNIIAGQSYSALFVTYVFLKNPELFNGYVATSLYFPQLKTYFLKKANEAFKIHSYDSRFLFISRGGQDYKYNKDGITEKALSEFTAIKNKYGNKKVHLNYKVYEDYGHCPEPSFIDGIQWIIQEKDK